MSSDRVVGVMSLADLLNGADLVQRATFCSVQCVASKSTTAFRPLLPNRCMPSQNRLTRSRMATLEDIKSGR